MENVQLGLYEPRTVKSRDNRGAGEVRRWRPLDRFSGGGRGGWNPGKSPGRILIGSGVRLTGSVAADGAHDIRKQHGVLPLYPAARECRTAASDHYTGLCILFNRICETGPSGKKRGRTTHHPIYETKAMCPIPEGDRVVF